MLTALEKTISLTSQSKFFPTAHRKFARVPNTDVWKSDTFEFLESVAQRIENLHGRLSPIVVPSLVRFRAGKAEYTAQVEAAKHFR